MYRNHELDFQSLAELPVDQFLHSPRSINHSKRYLHRALIIVLLPKVYYTFHLGVGNTLKVQCIVAYQSSSLLEKYDQRIRLNQHIGFINT
jgi:hypothetical protein